MFRKESEMMIQRTQAFPKGEDFGAPNAIFQLLEQSAETAGGGLFCFNCVTNRKNI